MHAAFRIYLLCVCIFSLFFSLSPEFTIGALGVLVQRMRITLWSDPDLAAIVGAASAVAVGVLPSCCFADFCWYSILISRS
jgi:hypothetical protein